MPVHHSTLYSTIRASVFQSASEIAEPVWDAFEADPRNSNIMYAHALKQLIKERTGESPSQDQYWISCSSHETDDSIDFVLSSTEGPLGSYPIFIFSTRPYSQLDNEFMRPRIELLALTLFNTVGQERVYSIFAVDPVARYFADCWQQLTGTDTYSEPYYAARLSFCTKSSFVNRSFTIHPDVVFDLRPAVEDDILDAASLCYGFAEESEPFVLSPERALEEATLLIQNRQLWVHTIGRHGESQEIASIVAVTRESDSVSAITKVFTDPKWRQRGCAERLVRRVCKHLLSTKESVILYVAHNNPAACKVYHRVGFAGLDGVEVEGADPWLEIGFDRAEVDLGHW